MLALIILYILFLFICSLLIDPTKEYEEHSAFYRALLEGATAMALPLVRIRLHANGLEKLPKDTRKLLFVCNHRSNFDPIVTWHVLAHWKIAFISKAENFNIPIFGRYIRKCCFMAIDRENPRNALKTIDKAADLLEKGEVSIGIYPEGTRSKTCVLLPFHNGVFKIAQKAGAPIVVLSVTGTEKIHRNFPLHHTDVYIDVLDVIPAETVTAERTSVIGEHVRACMEQCLGTEANRTQ